MHITHDTLPVSSTPLFFPPRLLTLSDAWPAVASRLEKLQVEHGVSMSRCTTLEEENALSESALASLRAGIGLCSGVHPLLCCC